MRIRLTSFDLRYALLLILVAVSYITVGEFGFLFAYENASVTAVWLPSGIALAALLLRGMSLWPAIFVGALFLNITSTGDIPSSLLIACGNTLEGVIAAWLILRFAYGVRAFERAQDIFRLVMFAMLGCALAATVGVMSLFAFGFADAGQLWSIWMTWFLGDLGGMLLFAPVLIVWIRHPRIEWNTKQWAEVLLFFAAFMFVLYLVFGRVFYPLSNKYPISFLTLPVLVWVATRFTQRETATAIFLAAVISLSLTVRTLGLFTPAEVTETLLLLQVYLNVMAMVGLGLSAAIAQSKESLRDLAERVHKRTRELQKLTGDLEREVQNTRKFKLAVDAATDAISITTPDLTHVYVNPAWERLTGYSSNEAVGAAPTLLLQSTRTDPVVFKEMLGAAKHGKVFQADIVRRRKDGSDYIAELSAYPILEKGQPLLQVILHRDITQRKRQEEVKNEFVTFISHQLRTPLTAIRWVLSSLQKQPLSEDIRHMITEAHHAATHMANTIGSMLMVAHVNAGELKVELSDVRMKQLVEEILLPIEPLRTEKNLAVALVCDLSISCRTDRKLLQEILITLLVNAYKYTLPNGRVTVRVSSRGKDVVIDVEDTGIGIPKNEHAKIFTKFFRGSNAMEKQTDGTGLGLYLVYALTQVLGGQITFTSEEKKGSIFTLVLPLTYTAYGKSKEAHPDR